MIDEKDFKTVMKKSGNYRKIYKATCDSCGCDRGYRDKDDAAKLCRSCTRVKVHASFTPEKKAEIGKKTTAHFIGGNPWNKGLTGVYSQEVLDGWSKKHKEFMSSEENRALSGQGKRTPWLKGKEMDRKTKVKLSCIHRNINIAEFDNFKHINKNQDRRKFSYLRCSKQCFERDNYTCQCCNIKGAHLHAHHLNGFDKFPEQRFIISNLITLCKSCHDNFHAEFGKGSNTEAQYIDFKTVILKILCTLTPH